MTLLMVAYAWGAGLTTGILEGRRELGDGSFWACLYGGALWPILWPVAAWRQRRKLWRALTKVAA